MSWRPAFDTMSFATTLWPDGEKADILVAAILDPIQWPTLQDELARNQADWLLVDTGWNSTTHADVLPYIVRLSPECSVTRQIFEKAGEEIGIFLRAKGNPEALLSVLAKYYALVPNMQLPDGEATFLRYYDPHVFRAFMPIATEGQRALLYGIQVQDFWAEDITTGKYEHFSRPGKLSEACSTPSKLSNWQLAALLEAQYQKFIEALQDHILSKYSPVPNRETINKILIEIATAIDVAKSHGFVSRREIAQFVEYADRFGFDFYEQESIEKILCREDLPAMEKLRLILPFLSPNNQMRAV